MEEAVERSDQTGEIENARRQIKSTVPPFRIGVVIGSILTALEIYQVVSQGLPASALVGPIVSLVVVILTLATTVMLSRENKLALVFWLVGLALGMGRWTIIDRSFALSIPAILLVVLFLWVTYRQIRWVRMGALR